MFDKYYLNIEFWKLTTIGLLKFNAHDPLILGVLCESIIVLCCVLEQKSNFSNLVVPIHKKMIKLSQRVNFDRFKCERLHDVGDSSVIGFYI